MLLLSVLNAPHIRTPIKLLQQMAPTSPHCSFFKQLELFSVKFQKYLLVKCQTLTSEKNNLYFYFCCFCKFLWFKYGLIYVWDFSDFESLIVCFVDPVHSYHKSCKVERIELKYTKKKGATIRFVCFFEVNTFNDKLETYQ